jgi:hypothetical protein
MNDKVGTSGTKTPLTETDIKDILLYVASWVLKFSSESMFNGEAIDPLHLDALTAAGNAKISNRGIVSPTKKGEKYIAHSLSTKDSFLNRFWRHIDFTAPTGVSDGVLNIGYQRHSDLFTYEQDLPIDMTILHIDADQHLATSFILYLEKRAVKAQAVALDEQVNDRVGIAQRSIDDSLFTILLVSAEFIRANREDAVIARLVESILSRNEGYVLPVILPCLKIPFPFDTLGCVIMSSSEADTVGELLVQKLARPQVLLSMAANPRRLTNEQKCQVLLWSLMMYKKSYGECYVLVENFLPEDDPDFSDVMNHSPILRTLADKELVDTKIWFEDIPVVKISDKGRQHLRRLLASRQSFIYQAYSEIITWWNDPSPWSIGLEPGRLGVKWKLVPIPMSATTLYEFDIALSFSGKDRTVAERLAREFRKREMKVFYEKDELAESWGQPLYEYLFDVYRKKAHFCIMLISRHYLESRWAKLERRAAQERDLFSESEYILPIRLDDAEVPGLLRTIKCLDYLKYSDDAIAELVVGKLK